MDINGIGKETIELMFENNLISNYSDLYFLNKESLLNLNRMAEKSVENIFEGLENSKKVPFERVLFALGIRYVGQTVAKNLAKKFKSIDNLILKSYDELIEVDEIGDRIARSVVKFLGDSNNLKNIEKLKMVGLKFEIDSTIIRKSILNNKTFVISGVFEDHSREELKSLIDQNGGRNLSSISSKTNFLLAGDKVGPSKLKKAKDFDITIIDEKYFIEMLNN
jgi:DNA ligase (NAD+)